MTAHSSNRRRKKRNKTEVDRVGFEPTTSAMPMPYPTGLDDRPDLHILGSCYDINTLVLVSQFVNFDGNHLEPRLIAKFDGKQYYG